LAQEALEKSLEVRETYGYDFRSPLCVYELAERAEVKVQFVDNIDMEGVYVALARPTILLSALRPLPRRAFTCAHELGHHFFGHGSTVDELRTQADQARSQPKEFIADAFAGFLLMPAQAVNRAFSSRGWKPSSADPEQTYRIACTFGVGYQTLIGHLQYALGLIEKSQADLLRRERLPRIRQTILGISGPEPLAIADHHSLMSTCDMEVGSLILLPLGTETDSDQIELIGDVPSGSLYRCIRPGLCRAVTPRNDWAVVVRASRFQYAGLARYRHLEETDGE
jgi:Zn-dependent peptidase ImmA (M78 family)